MFFFFFFFKIFDCCSITGLRPRTAVAEELATMCVLPLLLAGVLGAPIKHGQLAEYLRKLLVEGSMKESQPTKHSEIVDAVRFLWFVYQRNFQSEFFVIHGLTDSSFP